jgi:hypothetical protein
LTTGTGAVGWTGLIALALTLGLSTLARADFRYVTEWGSPGGGDGQFTTPFGIASNGAGTVYVTDFSAGRVQRFSPDGAFLGSFGVPGAAPGQFSGASHVAADAFGAVYVTDRDNARVQKFTSDGIYVLEWGTRGSGDGQFHAPAGVAIDSRGNVYVVDPPTNRVQRFTPGGAFDLAWGGPGRFTSAQDVAVDVFGDVYVLDAGANRVQKFGADGTPLLLSWGSAGAGDGQFNAPTGIATDGAGNVYVADTANQRVQQFTSEGTFVTRFGSAGTGPGQFANPVDVASDVTGAVYVVDQADARVQQLAEPAPPPEVGRTANIEPVSGAVLVRRPGAARFVALKRSQQIPIGSVVQATRGVAKLTTASDSRGGQQTALFYGGRFVLRQRRAVAPVTELVLTGGHFDLCPKPVSRGTRVRGAAGILRAQAAARRRKRSRRTVRQLWGDGRGRFRTKGHDASAGVRGTKWLTQDRCDGTLIRVRRGAVTVRDFIRKRTVIVRAGESYLAERR